MAGDLEGMVTSSMGKREPEPGPEQRLSRAQRQLSEAERSLYLGHRELETALRLHALTTEEVQRRIEALMNE